MNLKVIKIDQMSYKAVKMKFWKCLVKMNSVALVSTMQDVNESGHNKELDRHVCFKKSI